MTSPNGDSQVALLVDCDNCKPGVLAYALSVAGQLGRVVVRRGYGNHTTLSNKWQAALVESAFTPCLQFQYASGKNTSDIALALDAQELLFDKSVDRFCIVTSDSDFTYLCRKLRERGATVRIVGDAKTPTALRKASDSFYEFKVAEIVVKPPAAQPAEATPQQKATSPTPAPKKSPEQVVEAVKAMSIDSVDGKVDLSGLGQYLKGLDGNFSPKRYGHASLHKLIATYPQLTLTKEARGQYSVSLSKTAAAA